MIKNYKTFEFVSYLDEQELMEMSNITFKTTGINNVVIWVGPNPKYHGFRIKVSNIANKFDGKDCFVITIPELEIIGKVNKSLFDKDTIDKIFTFIQKNEKTIISYSNYEISTEDLLAELKPWNYTNL